MTALDPAMMHRRHFLISAALWFAGTTSLTRASVIRDHMPWAPYPSSAPRFERPGPWQFFTADEASAIEAIVDRIIPPDPQTPGGKEAGCAVFIDRQLKGPVRIQRRALQARAAYQGHQGAGAAVRADAGRTLSQGSGQPRQALHGEFWWQEIRAAFGRPAG